MFGGHPLSHNPARTPQVAMIHKFRIGERTEKQHVLLLGRAAQQNSNYPESWAGLSGLVPAIHAFLGCAFIRKAWMAAMSDMTREAANREPRTYLPPPQVEAPRTLNRNKIKAANDGSKLTFLPLPAMQKLLQFCHMERKILSIAIA
jgi:hypothetical protein